MYVVEQLNGGIVKLKKKISVGENCIRKCLWEDLWDEYCTLRKEVKELVIAKKLKVWNRESKYRF